MFIVDRIEEGIAVIYDNENNILNIKSSEINGNVRDGAVLINENGIWIVDEEKTIERENTMRERLHRLFQS